MPPAHQVIKIMLVRAIVLLILTASFYLPCHIICKEQRPVLNLQLEQLTSGSKHHFFGYIGQCQTIPWNSSGRYILCLEIDQIDRMPKPNEAATVCVIDTQNKNKIIPIDKTYGWNPQQGTMFYWHPRHAEYQFFFNDRDPKTGKVFTVLYDLKAKKRLREYRFSDTPIANGGVSANGAFFMGLNYGRLARLRLVTGYPDALDWSKGEIAPSNDGVFKVDIETGKKQLLASFRDLHELLLKQNPNINHSGLFINHTLLNRDGTRLYFFVRGGWSGQNGDKINIPCSIHTDGSNLTLHSKHIGGHPEWDLGNVLIGRQNKDQILYHVDSKKIIGKIGSAKLFPKPEGDISLSPNGQMFVNGYKKDRKNFYSVYRKTDGAFGLSKGLDKGSYSGDIRIDPAPRWNRTNDIILVPGLTDNKTRQLFLIRVKDGK